MDIIYKGFNINQSDYNCRITIYNDGKEIIKLSCNRNLDEKELKKVFRDFIKEQKRCNREKVRVICNGTINLENTANKCIELQDKVNVYQDIICGYKHDLSVLERALEISLRQNNNKYTKNDLIKEAFIEIKKENGNE